jgi:FixJ family two-component response regulator
MSTATAAIARAAAAAATQAPTVFVVDDDSAVRKALSRLLHSAGLNVSAFGSAEEFLRASSAANPPGCLVLDVAMPGLNGMDLQKTLAQQQASPLPIIFLTGRGDIPMSVRAMQHGAVDFLTKPADEEALVRAVHRAIEKDQVARQELAAVSEVQARLRSLTPREREVLEGVIRGKLNKQIAAELGTVEKTIKVHRARVMEKMEAESVPELVRLAQRAGLNPTDHDGAPQL